MTEGIYRRVRHPMYSAFWLWAIAQALLLSNWIAGFAGLAGFGILFFGRVAREERMMLETFGDSYRAYMARTGQGLPVFFPELGPDRSILDRWTTKATGDQMPQIPCHFRNIWQKNGCRDR